MRMDLYSSIALCAALYAVVLSVWGQIVTARRRAVAKAEEAEEIALRQTYTRRPR